MNHYQGGNVMPVVRVSFYEGRSDEQKREIAEIITDALGSTIGPYREGFHELGYYPLH